MSLSPPASLLQKHRPATLLVSQPPSTGSSVDAMSVELERHEPSRQGSLKRTSRDSSRSSHSHSRTSSLAQHQHPAVPAHPAPIPSTSHGPGYLNVPPTLSSTFKDTAAAETPSLPSSPVHRCEDMLTRLKRDEEESCRHVAGEMVPKDRWQPDSSSSLCTYPLCSTLFPPSATYFTLGPRRHHCRMCGRIFCSSHTTSRAPLLYTDPTTNHRAITYQRVCDLCIPSPSPAPLARSQSQSRDTSAAAEQARRNSISDSSDEARSEIITPSSDHPLITTASGTLLRPVHSRISLTNDDLDALAPIQPWMDASGVLSLYPLAVLPSHARSSSTPLPPPSAAPLFAPSLADRRKAKERLQIRIGGGAAQHEEAWVPGKWGLKREDWDPDCKSDEEEDGGMTTVHQGHGKDGAARLVVDGPIRYRCNSARRLSPGVGGRGVYTPSDERQQNGYF